MKVSDDVKGKKNMVNARRIDNMMCYMLIILFVSGFGYFFHSRLLMMFTVIFVTVPFITLIMAAVSSRRLGFTLEGNETVTKRNEEYILKLTFTNKSIIPLMNCTFRLEMKNDYSPESQVRYMNILVPGKGKRVVSIRLKPIICGRINVSVTEIYTSDIFYFKRFRCEGSGSFSLNVMPRRKKFEQSLLIGENVSDDTEKAHKDNAGNEIIDIREYAYGDSLKTVHWKASARRDELYVKERGDTTQDRTLLLFELNSEDMDGILDSVYTCALAYVKRGQAIRICWAGRGQEQLSSQVVYEPRDIYPMFSRVYDYIPSNAPEHTLSVARRQLSGGSVLYIASGEEGVAIVNL